MIDYLWSGLMIISIVSGVLTGNADGLTSAIFSGAQNSITIAISLCGCICFFSGLMNIAQKSGFTDIITYALRPILRIIFPGINTKSAAAGAIAMNMTANMLGLGNAATPFGLRAMKELCGEQIDSDYASDHMVTFVVINTASLQIIPTTVAMLRTKAGSKTPLDILPCVWVASVSALVFGIALANMLNRLCPIKKADG